MALYKLLLIHLPTYYECLKTDRHAGKRKTRHPEDNEIYWGIDPIRNNRRQKQDRKKPSSKEIILWQYKRFQP